MFPRELGAWSMLLGGWRAVSDRRVAHLSMAGSLVYTALLIVALK